MSTGTIEVAPLPLPAAPDRRRRQWLFRSSRRWTRRLLTIAFVVAVATFAEQLSFGAVPTVALAVFVGTVLVLEGRRIRPARRPVVSLAISVLLIGTLASASWSYNGYLDAPGAATTSVRTGDWMRDHGMSPIVDRLEQYLYAGQVLGNGRVAANQIPTGNLAGKVVVRGPGSTPAPVPLHDLIDKKLKGEGKWSPNRRVVNGRPVAYTTYIRPDRANTDVVAAAAWFDPEATRVTYVPGTKQHGTWAWQSGIPVAKRHDLIAAFNAGFKFKDIPGGYRTEGRTPVPLVDGQASLVLRRNGRVDIGAWGSEVTMAPDVVSVRQNLQLLVDHGAPVPAIQSSAAGEWGTRRWQLQHTNRSGLGITSTHALVYVSGLNLTTETLASALAKLGCVRAMELDIHATNPTLNFFHPDTAVGTVIGTKLTQVMNSSASRYLAPDQRDFFAVSLTRPGAQTAAPISDPHREASVQSNEPAGLAGAFAVSGQLVAESSQ